MNYSYISSYKINEILIDLHIWNKERLCTIFQILLNISEYEPLFNYHHFKTLNENSYLYDQNNNENLTCLFCQKDSTQTTFKKLPHVIPYLLGNKFLLHYEECDECNEFFGNTLECELDKYLNPHRTLNRQTNRRGNLIKSELGKNRSFRYEEERGIYVVELLEDEVQFDPNSNHVTFNLTQNKYIPMLVYKAFIKIAYGLLPREHLYKFESMRKWIINKDNAFIPFHPLTATKYRLNGFSTSILDFIILHKEVTNLENFKKDLPIKEDLEYLIYFRYGHIIFEFPILTDLAFQKLDYLKKNNLETAFNFPYIPKLGFPSEKEIVDFTETNKVKTIEPMYFFYDKKIMEQI